MSVPQTGNQECLIEISLGTPPQLVIASDGLFAMGLVSCKVLEAFKELGSLKYHLHVLLCRSLACTFLNLSSEICCLLSKIVASLYSVILHEVFGGIV